LTMHGLGDDQADVVFESACKPMPLAMQAAKDRPRAVWSGPALNTRQCRLAEGRARGAFMNETDDVEREMHESENLVCNLATALVQHLDALDNILGEAFTEPLNIHLLHHLAYRAGYEGHGEKFAGAD